MENRIPVLDVFRGLTVMLMILVNNPGSWDAIFPPLEHAPLHGCTPTDLVFPFFLFAVGNAMAFSLPKLSKLSPSEACKKIARRTILIFLLGLLLNWLPFLKWQGEQLVLKSWQQVRVMGVLQRIALCYAFASLFLLFFNQWLNAAIAIIILLVYWGIVVHYGGSVDTFSLHHFIGKTIDNAVFSKGHLYGGEGFPFDPEGLFSTIPAIVQVMIGYAFGILLIQNNDKKNVSLIFSLGISLILLGYCWSFCYPLTKKTWSSSYVLYTSGIAATFTALLQTLRKGSQPLFDRLFKLPTQFGKNPLFIFILSGAIPRISALLRWQDGQDFNTGKSIYITPLRWLYHYVFENIAADPRVGSLFYALAMLLFYSVVAILLDKQKIYVRV